MKKEQPSEFLKEAKEAMKRMYELGIQHGKIEALLEQVARKGEQDESKNNKPGE